MIQVLVRKDFGPPCKCFRKVPRHGRALCKRIKDNFIGIWGISRDHQNGRKKSRIVRSWFGGDVGLGTRANAKLQRQGHPQTLFFFAILITRCLTIASVCARARVRSCVRVYVRRSCVSVQCSFAGDPFFVIIVGCGYPLFSPWWARIQVVFAQ